MYCDIECLVTLAECSARTKKSKIASLSNPNPLLILIKAYLTLIHFWGIATSFDWRMIPLETGDQ
jgi:hypothetical protein